MNEKEEACRFRNLYKAMIKAKKGVSWKDSVAKYTNNGLLNILNLHNSLLDNSYKIDPYYKFTIYEPKKREITSNKLKDRVFQKSLCDNFLYSKFKTKFIFDNGACQINKGTDFCRDRLKLHLQRYYYKYKNEGYVLKLDMKNFFGSTPHSTAKKVIENLELSSWTTEVVYDIIDSYDSGTKTGLGLGSQITQLIQLLVLSDLDHFIKETLRVKYYVRYSDDMILISPSKDQLSFCLEEIRLKIQELGLLLNTNKTKIFKLSQGINFLGFKFILTDSGKVVKLILKSNLKKRRRKLKSHSRLVNSNKMSPKKMYECYNSWRSHADSGNNYKAIRRMNEYYDRLGGSRCLLIKKE